MIKASKILYIISAALAGSGLLGSVLTAVLSSVIFNRYSDRILAFINENAKTGFTSKDAELVRIFFIALAAIAAISTVVCLITAYFGYRALSRENGGFAPHVVAIVVGVFTSVPLVVAAILAFVGTKNTGAPQAQPSAQNKV